MKVLDLFPLCQSAECPQAGKHKHPLPHQTELLESSEKYVAMVGGYGSAKTLPAVALMVLLGLSVPGNRIFVGRRTYSKIHDSPLPVYMQVLERAGVEWKGRENRDGFPHRIILPNETEFVFRETKDIGRWLGPEYGGFHLEEAQEEPEDSFTGLMGRLRLPHAGQYLKGLLTTNPPPRTHWIPRWFGEEPGVRVQKVEIAPGKFIETAFRLIKSSTKQNPHLPPGYLADLLALPEADVRRIVDGDFGFVPDGPPVYEPFRHEKHVGAPALRPVPLIRGWDFGYRHPAVTWHQAWRCRVGLLHWTILHELDATQTEAERLGTLVQEETRRVFPDVSPSMLIDCGDAAGAAVSDKGPGAIIRLSLPPWNLRFRFRKITNIDPGLEQIRKLLRLPTCKCGLPVVQVHRSCRNVIDGFAGGYHLPKNRPNDKPVKDGFYDDFMDSVRYVFLNYLTMELLDPGTLDALAAQNHPRQTATPAPGWAWMGGHATPEQIEAEIARVKGVIR